MDACPSLALQAGVGNPYIHSLIGLPSMSRTGRPSGVGDQVERDAELGVDRGGDVFAEVFVLGDEATFVVGRAEDVPAGNAGTGHDGEAGRWPSGRGRWRS